ncbi:MAG: hypothetical protein ACI8VC_000750 [Candidatus Endobugula sp.]|jgi:hypothetical protein
MRVQIIDVNTLWHNRYQCLLAIVLIAIALTYVPAVNAAPAAKIVAPMVVYKSPSCGCCGAWIDHMQQAGFSTTVQHPKDLNTIKNQLGIPPYYQACHTATQHGYVFEGHIPADVIQHFLANKPDAKGLAVPGMPMGSPGMDTHRDFDAYDVLVLNKDGSDSPYARISSDKIIYLEEK